MILIKSPPTPITRLKACATLRKLAELVNHKSYQRDESSERGREERALGCSGKWWKAVCRHDCFSGTCQAGLSGRCSAVLLCDSVLVCEEGHIKGHLGLCCGEKLSFLPVTG